MENHNVSTSNTLLETLDDDIPIAVTLSTPSRDIGIKNKDSAPTTPYDNQVPLEVELAALKSFVLEQFFLIKKSIKKLKDPNHEAANSTYVVMLREQIGYLKEENKVKNSIIQSLTNQYNYIFNSTATSNNNKNNNNNNNNTLHKSNNNLPNTSNNNINYSSNDNNNIFSSIKSVSNNNNNNNNNNNSDNNNNNLHKSNNNFHNTSNNNNINNSAINDNNNFSSIKCAYNNKNKDNNITDTSNNDNSNNIIGTDKTKYFINGTNVTIRRKKLNNNNNKYNNNGNNNNNNEISSSNKNSTINKDNVISPSPSQI